MNDEIMLTLHCPQCKQITDVVTEGESLVCLDCGHKFDEKVAARVLGGATQQPAKVKAE
jgi:DNA-directed RNA polymerase subunit RPC12/RpoP